MKQEPNAKLLLEYEDYVEHFDPTPQYLYDNPYRLLNYDEWLEEYKAGEL